MKSTTSRIHDLGSTKHKNLKCRDLCFVDERVDLDANEVVAWVILVADLSADLVVYREKVSTSGLSRVLRSRFMVFGVQRLSTTLRRSDRPTIVLLICRLSLAITEQSSSAR